MKIIEREVGAYPISIGTSLALEGFFGTHPNQPVNVLDNKSVKEIWINLRTLVRNMFAAIPTIDQVSTEPRHMVDVLLSEVQAIPDILRQAGLKTQVRYYVTAADNIKWLAPKGLFKEPKTPKQILVDIVERTALSDTVNQMKDLEIPYDEINIKPERTFGTVLILTHYPHELLWKDVFDRLLLLESHTGRIKPYNQWYTKLNGFKSTDTPVPFNMFMLQVFGDGMLLQPLPNLIRKQLRQLAKDRKWTPVTTQDKLYFDLTTYAPKYSLSCVVTGVHLRSSGMFSITVKESGEYTATFVENRKAKRYVTLNVHEMNTKELFNEINTKALTLPPYSAIRLRCEPNAVATGDVETFRLEYPQYHWSIDIQRPDKKKETINESLINFDMSKYIDITAQSISELLIEDLCRITPDEQMHSNCLERLEGLL